MPSHFHCTVIANDGMLKDKIHFIHPVEITLMNYTSEEEAQDAARAFVTRKFYSLMRIWQCNTCRIQGELSASMKKIANHD